MMRLMQGYVKEGGAIGIDDLERWPPSSDAVRFLSETTSIASAAELLKVCVLISNYIDTYPNCCSIRSWPTHGIRDPSSGWWI